MTQENNPHNYLRLHIGILLAGATGIFGRIIALTEIPLVWYRMTPIRDKIAISCM